jgi:cysteine desulfurase
MFVKGFKLFQQSAVRVKPMYLDFQATSPVDPRVLDSMLPFLTEHYGNPHSRTHAYGWVAEKAVEDARLKISNLIKADPKEVLFTSGATESNNIAIKGVAKFYKESKNHVITTQTEHKCVLESCRQLEQEGFEVTYLPVKNDGLIDLKVLEKAIKPKTALISIMYVNNEIGVIQPMAEIGKLARKHKVFFHTDVAQALGKVPIDVNAQYIDLMSMSGHKIYGPKGVGALYVRRRPRVRIKSPISGGGQERGFRSGTVATPLVVGFGEACAIAEREMERDKRHIKNLSERLWKGIAEKIADVTLNGSREQRYPGNLNISFECVEGESLLMAMNTVAVSSGSACTSATLEPSYVLRALGVAEETAHTSLRFGIGRFTTEEEIDSTIEKLAKEVARLRDLSPLWDMKKAGIDLKTINWSQSH